MALTKQYGLSGLYSDVQFGKSNGRIKFDNTDNAFNARNLADSDYVNFRVSDPIINSDAATKQYVDSVAQGLKPKTAVVAATNGLTSIDSNVNGGSATDDMTNLSYSNEVWTLTGGVIDGVTLANGDRVLIKDATGADAVGNGIWVFDSSAGTLSRAPDADNLTPSGDIPTITYADIVKSGSTSGWEIGAATLTWPTTSNTSYGPDLTLGQDAEGEQTGHAVVAKEIDGESHLMIGQGGTYQDTYPNFHLYKFDSNGNRVYIGSIQTTTVNSTYGYDQSSTPSQHADFTKNSSGEYKIVVGSLNAGFQVWDVATSTLDWEILDSSGTLANGTENVACEGDYVVVLNIGTQTLPTADPNAHGYGRVFNLADGSHVHDLVPPSYDGFSNTKHFGYRGGVKIHGNWVAVGSSEWEVNSFGRVDIFDVTTGAHVRTLRSSASDMVGTSYPAGSDSADFYSVRWFGRQFQIDGDIIAVSMTGEPQAGLTGSGGMIEIYDLTSGERLARLQNPNGDQGNAIVGYHHDMGKAALDLQGDYVAIDGGQWEQGGTAGSNNNVVYLFNWRDGTVQEIYDTSGAYTAFGQEIALSGERLFIGAPYDDTGGGVNPGRVYQYNAASQAGSPETLIVNGTAMDIQGTPQQCADTINNLFGIPRLVASVNGQGQLTLTYSPNASTDSLTIDASSATTTGLPSGTFQPTTSSSGSTSAYGNEFGGGVFVFVLEGTVWQDSGWVVNTPTGTATLGTDPITWAQFSRVSGIYANDGLAQDGNRIYVRTDGTTIHLDNDDLAVKSSSTQYQSLISDGIGGTATWTAISLDQPAATTNTLLRSRGGFSADVSAYADQSLYLSDNSGNTTTELAVGTANQVLRVDGSGNLGYGTLDLGETGTSVSGVLDETNGGTGESTYTQYDLLIGDATNKLTKLSVGLNNQVLRVSGAGVLEYGAVDLAAADAVTGTLPESHGGTGQASYTQGDILYAGNTGADGTLAKLSIGATGDVLTVAGGIPTWTNPTNQVGISSTRRVALGTSDVNIGSVLPANSRVLEAKVAITSAYTAGTTITLGRSSATSEIATADEIDPETTGIYQVDLMQFYGSATQLLASVTGASTGAGYVVVSFVAE